MPATEHAHEGARAAVARRRALGEPHEHGTVISVRLTHGLLANLTSGRRPSVSHALGALRRRGLVERTPDGRLVLHGDAPPAVAELRAALA